MNFKDFNRGSIDESARAMSEFVARGGVAPLKSEPIGASRAGVRLWYVESSGLLGAPSLPKARLFAEG